MSEDEEGGTASAGEAKIPRAEVVKMARAIAEKYHAQGLILTVRQLYYQFVAQGLMPSGQKVYKRVVSALSEARVAGEFPMHLIEDRGRDAGAGESIQREDDVERAVTRGKVALGRFPDIFLKYAKWYGQPKYVSVWVEKEALAGVFEGPCRDLGVGLFACRGYPSVSSLHQWCRHASDACGSGRFRLPTRAVIEGDDRRVHGTASEAVILYFGDHDPDGLEIPDSCMRTIQEMRINGVAPRAPRVRLERVALTLEQVEEYAPPPFEAKITSARYKKYVDKTGLDEAWELDALDPSVLNQLIRDNVAKHWDEAIHETNLERIEELRHEMKSAMLADGWLSEALDEQEG